MPGCINQIQHVLTTVGGREGQSDGLRFDRDAPFPLDVHPVEVLGAHRAVVDNAGDLQHPIGQGRLAVVDMGDDAEVSDGSRIGVPGADRRPLAWRAQRWMGGSRQPLAGTVGATGPSGTVGATRGCPRVRVLLCGCRSLWRTTRRSTTTRRSSTTRVEGTSVANIQSKKRIRTNEKARLRNKDVKSSLKTAIRKFREAADAGDATAAAAFAREANRALDKAASKRVIHQNQAANRKSAISKRVAAL